MRALQFFWLLLLPLGSWAQAQLPLQQEVVPQVLPPQAAPVPQVLVPQTLTAIQLVEIQRLAYGSGSQQFDPALDASASNAFETATPVADGLFHAPQYMPGYPTAAVIFPRVVEVPCYQVQPDALRCKGYYVTPAEGRGEYLFFHPVAVNAVVSQVPAAPAAAAAPLPEQSTPLGAGGEEKPVPPAPVHRARPRAPHRKEPRG